jgi:cytochrome c556
MRMPSRALAVVLFLSAVLAAGSAEAANNAMKDLMKKMGAVAAGDDAKALVPLLAQAKSMKPADPEFAGWDASADKGKAAAASGDLAAAKAACKDCHTQYRDKYKAKYGSKAP